MGDTEGEKSRSSSPVEGTDTLTHSTSAALSLIVSAGHPLERAGGGGVSSNLSAEEDVVKWEWH